MANKEHVAILIQGIDIWNRWRETRPDVIPDLSNADFSGFEIGFANLSKADLRNTNLSRAYLGNSNLFRAYLSNSNLKGADLHNANLSRTQSLATNFNKATLTGACLDDWNINSATLLGEVICEYIYLTSEWSEEAKRRIFMERCPSSGNFAPGDFAKLVQKAVRTVDLIFRNGINWEAFAQSFQKLQIQAGTDALDIQSIENKGDGDFVIRVNAPSGADKAAIQKFVMKEYDSQLKMIEARYRAQLQAKDDQIIQYRQENTNLWEMTKLMGSRPINVEAQLKPVMSLTEEQIQILSAIDRGIRSDEDLASELSLDIDQVTYYVEEMQRAGYLSEINKSTIWSGDMRYTNAVLTAKGKTAVKTPDKILRPSTGDSQGVKYDLRGSKFGGGFAAEGGMQIGGTFNDLSQTQDLAEAASKIKQLLAQFQGQDDSEDAAQDEAAKALAEQAQQDPTLMGKLVNWGKALGGDASKAATSEAAKVAGGEAAKVVITKALALLGLSLL